MTPTRSPFAPSIRAHSRDSRALLILVFLFALLAAPLAQAQTAKSRSALYTEIDTNLPSTTGAITAAVLRAQLKNVVASAYNTVNADAQPIDADLTAIAALSSNGLLARTGAGTAAARTLTGTAAEITVTNGDGASGNPNLSLPAALTFTGKTITGGTFASPTLTTPALGTPSAAVLTSATGLPLTTGVTGTLAVTNGGTGRATSTTAYGLLAAGTTAAGAHQTLPAGATTEILVGGGGAALPVWTTATGSGAPVRATSPTLVTPVLGVATGTSLSLSNLAVGASANSTIKLYVAGTQSSSTWGTAGRGLLVDSATYTDTSGSGTIASLVGSSFLIPTFAASNVGVTYSNAAALYLAGDPLAGTNVTLTNSFAFWNAGKTLLEGLARVSNTTSASSSTVGAFVVGTGTAGTSVAIGGGQINAGSHIFTLGGTWIGATTFTAGLAPNASGIDFYTGGSAKANLTSAGIMSLTSTAASTSTTTGSFINAGGAGIAGALYVGGNLVPSQTNGIVGTTTNNNANAGSVGEYVTANNLSVALTSNTRANITSISLTAGDWDVGGILGITPSGGTSTYQEVSYSTTSATIGAFGARGIFYTSTTQQTEVPGPITRFSLASTTTIYLVASTTFASGSVTGSGIISARRVR